ncbi:hypothetical protein, partial [Rhizobium oryzihabitans]|uniref:hypothetical protein n=1 Tax=Rhizobium oryzihabitans TaxID=2267833 RepID=UPI004035F55D
MASYSLLLRTPRTVSFYQQHACDATIMEMSERLVDLFVESMSRYNDMSCATRETSEVMTYLAAMEARQREGLGALGSRLEQTIEHGMSSLGGVVSEQLTTMTSSLDATITRSVSLINGDALAAAVSSSLRSWIEPVMQCMKGQQTEVMAGLHDFENDIKQMLQAHMTPLQMRHDSMMSVLAGLPQQVSSLCATTRLQGDTAHREQVLAGLNDVRSRLEQGATQQLRDVHSSREIISGVEKRVDHLVGEVGRNQSVMSGELVQVPNIVKGVMMEAIKQLEMQTHQLSAAVGGTHQQLNKVENELRDLTLLRKGGDDLTAKVDQLSHQLTAIHARQGTNHKKGIVGESRMYELLCDKLPSRDDYDVQLVTGQAHNCDICIKRIGHPDVRVEVKSHGEQSGEKVRAKEVIRFQNDLLGLNTHGIFVSVYSGIVGKGEVELEPLANGKFAV